MTYCNGNPCEEPRNLEELAASMTRSLTEMRGAAADLADRTVTLVQKLGPQGSVLLQSVVEVRSLRAKEAERALYAARDIVVEALGRCAACAGMADGICPQFGGASNPDGTGTVSTFLQ